MSYTKPEKLNKGDLIGIISPASSPEDLELIENGIKYIEQLGYNTLPGKNIGKTRGYLAGTDIERIEDIHQMFSDKRVKAVFCIRGGYGAFRLLDKIDYKLIQNNPKIFVGFSEITSLQMAFLNKANLITFAGPMVAPNFSKDVSSYTEEYFWSLLTSVKKPNKIILREPYEFSLSKRKNVSGIIVGGNLSVFTSMIGTSYLPEPEDKIILLEDVSEPPYKIDRMLNQLRLNNILKRAKGIILGSFAACSESNEKKKTLTTEEVLEDYFKESEIPVIYNFPHGHIKDFVTVPIGINIKLNMLRGFVEFTENAVR